MPWSRKPHGCLRFELLSDVTLSATLRGKSAWISSVPTFRSTRAASFGHTVRACRVVSADDSDRPSGDIGERQVCGAPPCPSHNRPNRSSLRRHRGARPGVPSIKHHHRPVRQWQAIYSFDARFRNSREARRRLAARRRLRTSTQLPQPASPLVKADRVGARSCACTPGPATSSGSGRPSSRAAAVRASEGAIWMP
jgi:hypothetical protein